MTEKPEEQRDWDRHEWASDEQEGVAGKGQDVESSSADAGRWNKTEWVGEDASGHRPAPESPEEMPEGEPGLSGSRHTPGEQHWVSEDSSQEGRTEK
jgi:hypothetical protein